MPIFQGSTARRPPYERRFQHDPEATGIFYMGREIAQVMGHEGADWLDRPEREEEEGIRLLVRSLGLKRGMVVADIGAGSGTISFLMAPLVGPSGKVLAVDIQPEMLDIVRRKKREFGDRIVEPVLGKIDDPNLKPASVDLAILVDVYHEFDHPWEMTKAMVEALRPGGRLVLVEYRKEDPGVPIKESHKMSVAQVRKEMSLFPLDFVANIGVLPRQHILVFKK